MRKRIFSVVIALCLAVVLSGSVGVKNVEAVACSSGAPAQNGITVVPSHGTVFYIDTGVTPVLDAGYVGYRVTNGTGSTQSSLWTEVSSFTGGKVTLANALDSKMQLPSLTNGSTGISYFMLKGAGASVAAQTHTVKVYNNRPDLSGATVLYECTFTFSKVQETIKAAANKVTEVDGVGSAIEVSDSSPELGQLVTITVEGQTGQIGAGSSPDLDIIWLAPAAVSSWPTRALRLESVSITFDGNGNWAGTGDQVTYTNQLLIQNTNGLTNVDSSEYRISYGFRVIGQPTTTVKAVPIAQIASGTQVKHSDTGATGATLDITFSSLAVNAALTKSVTATTGLTVEDCNSPCSVPGASSGIYVEVPYRLTAASTTATTLTIDEFVDTPGTGIIFKPGSATITDIGRTDVAVSNPVYIASESGLDPRPYHFIGPFTLNSGTTATLNYKMWVPVGSFSNIAYASIGDLRVGATSSAMSRITVTSTGTSTVGVVSDTVGFSVAAITDPATSITSTTATINGTVDPNGAAILTGQFEYGTSPTLVGATTVTATTPVSGNLNGLSVPTAVSYDLTGLTAGTTYYYRVVAGSSTGLILSFSTLAVLSPPTVTTTAATSLALTGATLNGTINPNLTPITGILFVYGTSASLASGNTIVAVGDGADIEAALTAGGFSEQAFSKAVTGLTAGTTYYFKIRACASALSGTYPSNTCTTFTDGAILSFVASAPPTVTTDAATAVGPTVATLNGTINANAASTTTSFVYGTVADLSSGTTTVATATVTGTSNTAISTSLIGLAPSTTYYFRATGTNSNGAANGSILSFTTTAAGATPRTLTIDSGSYVSTYLGSDTPPTITSTASAGTGTKTYSSSTPGVCTIGETTGVVVFTGIGTCTIGASIATDGTYAAANASTISFDVSLVSRTHTIDSGSYVSSYAMTATPPTITSTPSAGTGTKSYSSSTTGVCTVNSSSGVVTFVSAGTCTIGSSITASGVYDSATASTISFSITLASRTHTIDSGSYTSTYNLLATPPTITSTPSAGTGTKSYSSSTTGVCTVNSSSGVVTFVSAGTCTIGSSIAADGTYAIANASTISFDVTLVSRTHTIDSGSYVSSYTMTATPPTITSTPSAGTGTKSYSSSTTGVCTVNSSSGVVTFVSAGTCTIGSSITASGVYDSATASTISFSITLASRTHTIDSGSYTSTYNLLATPPTITSTPSAGTGTKSYSSSTTSVCTINSSTGVVTFVSAGTCTIGSSIAADGTYAIANASTISFDVTLVSRTHTIDSGSYTSTYNLLATPPTITSTPSAGTGTKSYSSSTTSVCTINSSTGVVTFVSAGTCTIGSSITASGVYDAATASTASFSVTLVSRTHAIDSGSYVASYALNATPPTITSTPSAGTGTKSYTSSTTGVCTVNSSTGIVTFVSAGTCTIGSTIAANGSYAAATATSVSFTITASSGGGGAPAAPTNASVIINAGASCTATSATTLSLSVSSASDVMVSNYADFSGASWVPHSATSMPWTLLSGDGTRTVYVRFKQSDTLGSTVSDSIVVDDANDCVTPPATPPGGGSPTPPTTPPPTVPPAAPLPPAVADFSGASFDLYIVNPDGTERHMSDPAYARVESAGPNVTIVRFEDKGSDFDFDDVVVLVDHTDWNNVIVTVLSVDAGWLHNIRLAIFNDDKPVYDLLIWPDSHIGIGTFAVVDANTGGWFFVGSSAAAVLPHVIYIDPKTFVGELPEMFEEMPEKKVVVTEEKKEVPKVEDPAAPKMCAAFSCDDVSYDLHIVNPDGSERRMGSRYTSVATLPDGRIRVGFEDSGRDFDFNDVVAIIDKKDCSAVKFTLESVDAGWHHRMIVDVFLKGKRMFDALILEDTHVATGTSVVVDVRNHPAMCVEAVPVETPAVTTACTLSQPFTAPMALGATGPSVQRLQEFLKCQGYFPASVPTTQLFAGYTLAGVRAFQTANGLAPLGSVGPGTRSALNTYVRQ